MASGYPDFEGDKSKLFTVADWAAVEANDKTLGVTSANKGNGTTVQATYTVPAGKTLFITQFGFAVYATNAADADNNQICRGAITNVTTGVVNASMGGNGGGGMSLTKPMVLTEGQQLALSVANESNHNCDLQAVCSGYEI